MASKVKNACFQNIQNALCEKSTLKYAVFENFCRIKNHMK